jgi:hypothetical protein
MRRVRIHPAGDFYSVHYIKKWIRIARRCSSTVFYAYTRAWRRPELLAALLELNKLKNVMLWWSTDRDTVQIDGRPPQAKGVRVAHMQIKHSESIPAYADLVFRVRRNNIRKYVQGRLVCPVENGFHGWVYKMTCSDCRICYRDKGVPKRPRNYTGPPILTSEPACN